MRRVAFVSLFVVAGCTPMQWQKADLTPEQLQADEQACRQHAWREASFRAWHHQTMLGPLFMRDATVPMVDPYGHQLMEEYRLAQFCMESKGYELVPVPKQ